MISIPVHRQKRSRSCSFFFTQYEGGFILYEVLLSSLILFALLLALNQVTTYLHRTQQSRSQLEAVLQLLALKELASAQKNHNMETLLATCTQNLLHGSCQKSGDYFEVCWSGRCLKF